MGAGECALLQSRLRGAVAPARVVARVKRLPARFAGGNNFGVNDMRARSCNAAVVVKGCGSSKCRFGGTAVLL